MRISDWSSDVCSSDLIACPLLSTERELVAGDVLWVDCGIVHHGFHSDFGRTWVVGQEPTARQQAQYARWNETNDAVLAVLRAGVTAAEITDAAMAVCDGDPPVRKSVAQGQWDTVWVDIGGPSYNKKVR